MEGYQALASALWESGVPKHASSTATLQSYEGMAETPDVFSHLYQEGLVLLQMNGELPKAQADGYADVLRKEI